MLTDEGKCVSGVTNMFGCLLCFRKSKINMNAKE